MDDTHFKTDARSTWNERRNTSRPVGLNSTEIDEVWQYFERCYIQAGHSLKESVIGAVNHALLRRHWG